MCGFFEVMRDTESSPRGSHAGREREREEGRNALYIQRGHDLFIREREREEGTEWESESECRLANYATCPFGAALFSAAGK